MNLDTLPEFTTALEIIDKSLVGLDPAKYFHKDDISYRLMRDFDYGASAIFVPVNDNWGLKMFYDEHYPGSEAEQSVRCNIELNDAGLAPYIHPQKEIFRWGRWEWPCYWVERVEQFCDRDTLKAHVDYQTVVDDLKKFGMWDFKPVNMGLTKAGRLVMLDCSHQWM